MGMLLAVLVACDSVGPVTSTSDAPAQPAGSFETLGPAVAPTATPRPGRTPRPTPSPGRIEAISFDTLDRTGHVGRPVSAALTLANRGGTAISPTFSVTPGDGLAVTGCRPTCRLTKGSAGQTIASWGKLAPGKKTQVTILMRGVKTGQAEWTLALDSNADGTLDAASEPTWHLTTYVFP
jgi:hypothetical protein